MSDREILRTSADGRYRAVLEDDIMPCEPMDDGMVPLLRIDTDYHGYGTVAKNDAGEGYVDAYSRLGGCARNNSHQREIFERYLRIFHDAVEVQWYNVGISREYGYVAFDTASWRKDVGLEATPELLVGNDYMAEWRAWVEGDCYGVVVQELAPGACGHEGCVDHSEWVPVDDGGDSQIWGLYGDNEYTRSGVIDYYFDSYFKEAVLA